MATLRDACCQNLLEYSTSIDGVEKNQMPCIMGSAHVLAPSQSNSKYYVGYIIFQTRVQATVLETSAYHVCTNNTSLHPALEQSFCLVLKKFPLK